MDATVVFAGVDEAGLGPLLGPLTLGFSVFRRPAAIADVWSALHPIVSDDPERDASAFVVADSKRVFKRSPRCAKRLEATALGFLALSDARRDPRSNLNRLLWESPPELACDAATVAQHAWYRDARFELPLYWDARALELRVESLWRALRRTGIELLDLGVRVVPEASLNRSFAATDNKSRSHWDASRPLFQRVWARFAESRPELVVDRHGGRMHYGHLLASEFPEASVTLVEECAERSSYHIEQRGAGRAMRVTFAERAESESFAVALASCLAKYARESAMLAFNRYFAALQPALAPTAGYTTDGRRWLADAQATLEREGIDRSILVRAR